MISAYSENQSLEALVTNDHAAGGRIRPTIWRTPVLNEGDDLALASPGPEADLTVVIPA